MARAIDADELEKKFGYGPNDTEEERAFNQAARKIIREMPTLTPPNEPLTCEGCIHEHNEHENCNYCMRASYIGDYYYSCPPEEDT